MNEPYPMIQLPWGKWVQADAIRSVRPRIEHFGYPGILIRLDVDTFDGDVYSHYCESITAANRLVDEIGAKVNEAMK